MAKNLEVESNAINLIGTGTIIEGNVTSNGDIRVDGTLIGNMNTKGKVIVGESGKVKGEVYCKVFEVEGTVEGKVYTSELMSLRASSRLIGDITSNKLAIEPGAVFTGNCDMTSTNNFDGGKAEESKINKKE